MRNGLIAAAVVVTVSLAVFQNCGGFNATSPSAAISAQSTPVQPPKVYPGNLSRGFNAALTGPNIIPITVGACGFNVPNLACVSVTICEPNTANCQTIPNIQLSTFDSGLRIFRSAVTLSLPAVTVSNASLAECDPNSTNPMWGPVYNADIKLGGEPSVNGSIQIIDSTYATAPSNCANAATSTSEWGANGTLGLGLGAYDCGPGCQNTASNDFYFACSGSTCTPTTVQIDDQLVNPVWLLPVDNNGIAITLPPLANHAASTPVTGSLIIGIGTEANNTPISAVGLLTDDYGFLTAQIGGQSVQAYFDIFNNLSYFPNADNFPPCTQTSAWQSFYCPATEQELAVTFTDRTNSTSIPSTIAVGNAYNESSTGSNHAVWDDVGLTDTRVVLGVGFFYGKTIYAGIVTTQSPLGIGPYYGF